MGVAVLLVVLALLLFGVGLAVEALRVLIVIALIVALVGIIGGRSRH